MGKSVLSLYGLKAPLKKWLVRAVLVGCIAAHSLAVLCWFAISGAKFGDCPNATTAEAEEQVCGTYGPVIGVGLVLALLLTAGIHLFAEHIDKGGFAELTNNE